MVAPTLSLNEEVVRMLRGYLDGTPGDAEMTAALRLLAKWRARLIDIGLEKRSGQKILSGPFQGMDYSIGVAEGSRSARLIGAYEASLHPVIEQIIASAYPLVIDVGCAEGYYAVGLARRMPATIVMARDESTNAQALCGQLAAGNGVADRVKIGGRMDHSDFDICTTARTLVLCDIEAAEEDLLDPARAPGLRQADILVEAHDCIKAGIGRLLADRFAPTHHVTVIGRKIDDTGLPKWMEGLSDLDRLIALWEWRSGPTPWLWMVKK